MDVRRRARVAARLPGLIANDLSSAELRAYERIVTEMDAEAVLNNPLALPSQIGQATTILTGSRLKGETAKAKAIVQRAIAKEGM